MLNSRKFVFKIHHGGNRNQDLCDWCARVARPKPLHDRGSQIIDYDLTLFMTTIHAERCYSLTNLRIQT